MCFSKSNEQRAKNNQGLRKTADWVDDEIYDDDLIDFLVDLALEFLLFGALIFVAESIGDRLLLSQLWLDLQNEESVYDEVDNSEDEIVQDVVYKLEAAPNWELGVAGEYKFFISWLRKHYFCIFKPDKVFSYSKSSSLNSFGLLIEPGLVTHIQLLIHASMSLTLILPRLMAIC